MISSGNEMQRFRYHKYYSLHFKISLIISEIIVILLFLFTPSLSTNKNRVIFLDEISSTEIIPLTILPENSYYSKPTVPEIILSNFTDDDIILEDVSANKKRNDTANSELSASLINDTKFKLNSIPRQIMEVLPQQSEGEFYGSVTLRLKIDKNGKVSDYKILFSDINCKNCIEKILAAAYQSIWEPAQIKGKTTEYWIEKTYNFN